MTDLTLYIANKNYSSWSFRPWIALTAAEIDFKEVLIRFDFPAGNPGIKAISPTGQVPVLVHGDVKVWESLAIIEYAAELFPNAGIWPSAQSDRAVARAISLEMLAGFRALRNACPMNLRRPPQALAFSPEEKAAVQADVSRIETIWHEQLARSGGPFLFGAFSAADAMYAPVVNRFSAYQLTADPVSLAYMDHMQAHSAWIKWRDAALAEPWIVPEDEA
ncbi:glutathione S-transferase family protein [Agrobacterium vitis]|uniref:Glutathione S-transferase n=1 Tax=Agrobacterium vitis TaxID=373 RepID=A0AAE4WFT3_AGRVI|nr:glutathione S-transferase family protein [Agrobacterium vitis]MCF1498279.1 glutathione S-transferase family protein [Allorhizobium sp. Av2]MCM2440406.1 glutathione S-transferase family protein [Agrobacterium vitis]MUZ58202.1 glutathione S-transferase [Agrobacterium vitis]MVA66164.1 glutathione S-transferase [Agrobacterium vitis]MVA87082.1 glutathione S-transferase [Agrobacterium vitis]